MPASAQSCLGVALRALEPRRFARWPEDGDAGGGEIVDDAGDERRLRPDHDEVDSLLAAEGDDRRMIGDVERDELGAFRDAGIARRGVELPELRRLRELPGQRMLAPAGADEEDVHRSSRHSPCTPDSHAR